MDEGTFDIKHNDAYIRVADIGGDDTPKPLLPRSVPELQLVRSIIFGNNLRKEIDADGSLHGINQSILIVCLEINFGGELR